MGSNYMGTGIELFEKKNGYDYGFPNKMPIFKNGQH